MNSPMKKRIIVVAITLALTGIQAEAAKTNNKDKYKDVMVYGNVTLEQDSMKEWGPWEQFIQPAAGAPVPPPVAAITPDPIPEIREPIIPEEEVASACEPGAPCGYASYRHYGGQEYEYGGGEGGAWDYTSGEGAPAKIDITVDTTDEDPGIDNFQVTPTKARDNYSPVNSVEMEYYNYYSYDVYSEGNDWDDDYNGQDSNIGGYQEASPTTYSGYWYDGSEGGYGDDDRYNEWYESRYGDFVYGITTSQEGLDELHLGDVEAYYEGNTMQYGTYVEITADFGDGTWSGSWNGGSDGYVWDEGTDSHGVDYVGGEVGFHASGDIVGVNLTADEITADDGIIDQDLSTVEMSVFGDYAETMGGVHDITKTVEPEVCIVCEGNTVSYENARQVDVIAIDRIEPE